VGGGGPTEEIDLDTQDLKCVTELKVWHLRTGRPVPGFSDFSDRVFSVAFSSDGRLLASGGGGSDKHGVRAELLLWDTATGNRLAVLEGHKHVVYSVAFSPDGKRLASGGSDGTVKVWNVEAFLKQRRPE
jgi:WD40 repeat protein